jgi:hypothetical protein
MSYDEKYLKYKAKYLALKKIYKEKKAQKESNLDNQSSEVIPSKIKLIDLIGGAGVEGIVETDTALPSADVPMPAADVPAPESRYFNNLFQDGGAKKKQTKPNNKKRNQFFEDSDITTTTSETLTLTDSVESTTDLSL